MKQTVQLTTDKLKEIYKDEQLRNQVAFAHGSHSADGKLIQKITCSYPITYIVTNEQIQEAETERQRAKKQAIKDNSGKLVFVGMGCDYAARYEDDVCNHRVRTEIINPEGRKFFIEVGAWGDEAMRIDFVIDRDQENEYEQKQWFYYDQIKANGGFNKVGQNDPLMVEYKKYQQQPYYWFKREQWKDIKPKYTMQNVLNLVNTLFDCKFTEIIIDNYNLSTDDYSSVSPK